MNKKILIIVTGYGTGGGKKAVLTAVKELKYRNNLNIELFIFGAKEGIYKDSFESLNLPLHYKLDNFIKQIHEINPEVIFVDSFVPTLYFKIYSILFNKKLKIRFGAIPDNFIRKIIYKFLLFKSDILVPSINLKNYLYRSLFKPLNVDVVENFIPAAKCHNKKVPFFDFITIARFTKRKRIHLILEAAIDLKDYSFVVIGNGKLFTKFQKLIQEKGISNITLLGNITNVGDYLKSSNTFYLPSTGEGFCYSIYEALQYECKVVVHSDLGGNNLYLSNDPNYFIIDFKDHKKIEEIYDTPFRKSNNNYQGNTTKQIGVDYETFLLK